MDGRSSAVGLLCLAVALAGCADGGTPAPADIGPAPQAVAEEPFRLEASDCIEGGGHSVHPKLPDYLPEPWLPADVLDDTGKPPLTSEFWAHPTGAIPEEGNTMGNWHVTMMCGSTNVDGRAVQDHVFGYVGMRVEPPSFDTGSPVDRHYLITVIASNDAGLREQLHHHGFHAVDVTGHVGIQDNGLFHNILDTEGHGVYESYFRPTEAGPMPASYRLWFQKENGDGTFSPVALDVQNLEGTRLRAEGFYGTFTHLETEDHFPLPGAAGECPGVGYAGFGRLITLGPAPNVTLEEAYIHL